MNTDIMSKAEAIKKLEEMQDKLGKRLTVAPRMNGKNFNLGEVVEQIGALEIAINELRRSASNDTL